MTKQTQVFVSKLGLAAISCGLMISYASAQNLEKFTVTGEMAKKALIKGEINVATAEKLSQVCVEFAKQHKLEVANVILAPSGEIVYAYRMDGNAQSPFIYGNRHVEGEDRVSPPSIHAGSVQCGRRKR